MKVEEPNWFMRWEEELPSPDELMPLSQTLITPDLALAFDLFPIRNSNSNQHLHSQTQHDSSEMAGGGGNSGGGGGEEQARTLKRPRLVWTPQLHKRFVDAVSHLGIKHAVPKTIMQLMNVDGLTRENVASHLQKYRLYLKRMQGISSGTNGVVSHSDEQLFANGPIPHHFLIQRPPAVGGGGRPEPLVPIVALQQHHHQMAADAAAAQHYRQQQFNHHPHQGSFRWPLNYDHGGFLGWQHSGLQRTVGAAVPTSALVEDSDSGDGPRVLTLFPTNDR